MITDLIDNLDFDDSDSKEKEEEITKEDSSTSEKNNKEDDTSKRQEDQSSDSDLNALETSFESFNENEDLNRKEVSGDPNLLKQNQSL